MLFSTKKIRTIILGAIVALWGISVLSLGMTSSPGITQCDTECPMEIAHKSEISYNNIKKKVVMLSGIVGWVSQYYFDE